MARWFQAFQPNWQEFQPAAALYGLPGLLAILAAGLLLQQPIPALVAGSGALVVGFGALQVQFANPRTPMLAVAVGASLSAGIGTLANAWLPAEAACTMLWGTGLGLMNLIAAGPGWLALQGAIALVIASSFPATPRAAAERLLLVLAGAAIQLCIVLVLWAIAPRPIQAMRWGQGGSATIVSVLKHAWSIIARRESGLGFALAMGAAVTLADLIAHWIGLQNGYWVAMTVLLVLRPNVGETASRGTMRLAGTLLGAGFITLLTAWLRPPQPWIFALIGIAVWSCYALTRVNYALLSLAVTSYVVLLLALAGLPEPMVALHRAIATTIGGLIAIGAHALYHMVRPLWPRPNPPR